MFLLLFPSFVYSSALLSLILCCVPDAASLPVSPLQSGGVGVNTSLHLPPFHNHILLLSSYWLLGGSKSAPAR